MTSVITLYCNGSSNTCTHSFQVVGANVGQARSAARSGGWETSNNGRDYCPRCRPICPESVRHYPGATPPGSDRITCPTCVHYPDSELRTLLGHDHVGHLVANILARYGVNDLAALHAFPDRILRNTPRLGRPAWQRIQHVRREHPLPPPNPSSPPET